MAEDLVPFNGADEQVVARWLDEAGEVVVQVYYAHSGGGPHNYLVRSIADFRQCVAEGRARRPLPGWRDIICFDVFGGPMFFLRGRADQELESHFLNRSRAFSPRACRSGTSQTREARNPRWPLVLGHRSRRYVAPGDS